MIITAPVMETFETSVPTFDEQTIKDAMWRITQAMDGERKKCRDAYKALMEREHVAHLAIKFNEPTLLKNPEAREYLIKADRDKVKLIAADIEKLTELELKDVEMAYKLAKFDVESSDKAYSKWEKQLSFIQSEMRLV